MDFEQKAPERYPRTASDFIEARDQIRASNFAPLAEASYGAQPGGTQWWNQGLRILTNRTRLPGEPVAAGMDLWYWDPDWSPFFGPGEPLGKVLKEDDQRPNTNTFDAKGIILPWCSDSKDVKNKAIRVHRIDLGSDAIEEQLLYLFQYAWDNKGYYLPFNFAHTDDKVSMGEGPSSNLNVDFSLDPAGKLIAGAVAA